MLITFMIGGLSLGALHRLGMAGRIPHYGIEAIRPKFRLGALLVLGLCIAPYADGLRSNTALFCRRLEGGANTSRCGAGICLGASGPQSYTVTEPAA